MRCGSLCFSLLGSTLTMLMPSISNSASTRSTSPTLAPAGSSCASRTPFGCLAPAARHVQVPSSRELVSSISIRRAIAAHANTLPEMQAPPVVLVHGFASSFERNWRQPGWVDLLEEGGRPVIPVDLLGHGDAPKPHDPAAYADLESGVEAVLPEGPVDGLGFSLGARVLLTLAARVPDRFGKLVVGGVGANLFREDSTDAVARVLEGGDLPSHP